VAGPAWLAVAAVSLRLTTSDAVKSLAARAGAESSESWRQHACRAAADADKTATRTRWNANLLESCCSARLEFDTRQTD